MKRVFVDNYAAIPPASVRRILALAEAGHLNILSLGDEYSLSDDRAGAPFFVTHEGGEEVFDVIVVATGGPQLSHHDYPFPSIMAHLARVAKSGQSTDLVEQLRIPDTGNGSIYFLALPYLLADRPFVQGLVGCYELGERAAACITARGNQAPTRLAMVVESKANATAL